MIPVFVDTSGWASLADRTQKEFAQAATLYHQWREQGREVVTTNYVLAELIALLMSPLRLPRQEQFRRIDLIRTSKIVEIVHVTPELDAAAWALLKARADKEWSLVDAVSFLVMEQRGITEALTTDHHFEQAGFTRLLGN